MLRQNLKKPIYELTEEEKKEWERTADYGGLPPGAITFEHYGYKMEDDGEGNKVLVPVPKSTDTGPIPKIKNIPGKVMQTNSTDTGEVPKVKNIPGKFTEAEDSDTGPVAKIKQYPFSGIDKTETAPLKFMDALRNKYSNRVKRIKRR